jgi:hypothetical protein
VRSVCRLEDLVKVELKDIGCENVDWIQLVQDRAHWRALSNTLTTLWALQGGIYCRNLLVLASQEAPCSVQLDERIWLLLLMY